MDILVLALIFVCAVYSVHALLNDKVKSAAVSLLPIPALAIYGNHLGIEGLYQLGAFMCIGAMLFEFVLVKQLNSEKHIEGLFLLLGAGYIASVYICHSVLGMGVRTSITMASCYYIYVFNLALILFHKVHKEVALLPEA